jgi:hypothetical protein
MFSAGALVRGSRLSFRALDDEHDNLHDAENRLGVDLSQRRPTFAEEIMEFM